MKTIAVSTMLFLAAMTTGAQAQDAEHIAWRILGSNPDVFAPVFPQPAGHDYFERTVSSGPEFLHPAFAASFADIRRWERQEAVKPVDDAGLKPPIVLALLTTTP